MATLPKGHRAINEAKLWTPGDKRHLNSRRLPNDVNAPTDFAYLTTNGTPNGVNYLKA